MSLNNLVGKTLERIEPDATTIQRLMSAARRNIADAHVQQISNENRFDAAYKAIMQLANAALQANGYRTLTSQPGHHRTMIQTLTQTIELDNDTVNVLDALRKQRNVADYVGDPVPAKTVDECLTQAEDLFQEVIRWLKTNRSDFLPPK